MLSVLLRFHQLDPLAQQRKNKAVTLAGSIPLQENLYHRSLAPDRTSLLKSSSTLGHELGALLTKIIYRILLFLFLCCLTTHNERHFSKQTHFTVQNTK